MAESKSVLRRKDIQQPSQRVRLNRLCAAISASNSDRGPQVEIKGTRARSFLVILKGKRANLCFEGDFNSCQAYLFGIRDKATADG